MLKYTIYREFYNGSERITFTSRDAKEKYDDIFTDETTIGKMSTNLMRMTEDNPRDTIEKSILKRIKKRPWYHYWISENVTNDQQFPVKLKLFFCPETNTINVNLLLYFM